MVRREKLFLGSSLLHYFDDSDCNMLLKSACINSRNMVQKTANIGPKMVPKTFQNRPWRWSGGHLRATLETRCFQDLIVDDFGTILAAPSFGTSLGSFGASFFLCFLKWVFNGLGLHLGSQKTSKMRPQRGPTSRPENR